MTKYRVVAKSISDHLEIGEHDSLDKALAHLACHITNYVANGNSGHVLTIENSRACLRLSTKSDDFFDEDDRFLSREFKSHVFAGLKSNFEFSDSCNIAFGRWKYDIVRRDC
jgi:hypothetical protein